MKKIVLAFTFFIGLSFAIFGLISFLTKQQIAAISTFDECAAAGYPILESYPEQCMTPDKRSFTRELSEEEKEKVNQPIDLPTCGNGYCETLNCIQAKGCPVGENPKTCPQDCSKET